MNMCIFNNALDKESNGMMSTKDTEWESHLVEEGKEWIIMSRLL